MSSAIRSAAFPTGELNTLVDVPGVLVGHRTLDEGRSRTGVTAILPHADNLYEEKVLGACHVINGYGKAAGLSQLEELGTIESPILLTSTLSVGPVWEGGLRHLLDRNPEAARDRDTVNVIVGECFDGWLSDARALAVRPEHALEAIAAAVGRRGERGRGRRRHRHDLLRLQVRGGHARRGAPATTRSAVSWSPNYGSRRDLHMLVGPVEARRRARRPEPPAQGGSIMIVLATDAPLGERQLRRLAARAAFGLGRAGSFATNASGEYALAFSTAQRIPHRSDEPAARAAHCCATTRPRCASSSRRPARSCTRRCSTHSARPPRWRAATATASRRFPTSCSRERPGCGRASTS